jgi:quercetin dioxygenase-like cupin family protein
MPRRAFIAIAAVLACSGPGWAGDAAYPTVDILSTGKTVVGEDIRYPTTGPAHVTGSIVTIAPGADTVLHTHQAPLFAYVLEGTLTVDYGDKGKRSYQPGEAFMEAMATTHRGMNLGTAPVRLLAVYMGAEGTRNTVLAPH